MSNLHKYDTDKWALFVNQTKNSTDGLDYGTYTYQAFVSDISDNENQTEERTITILPCGSTITSDTTLTEDLSCSGHGLIFGAGDITLDCDGHRIKGSGTGSYVGVNATSYDNVIVKDCYISDFALYGIYFEGSDDSWAYNDTVDDPTCGINIADSDGARVENSTSNNNTYGICVYNSLNVIVRNNTVFNNSYAGVYLEYTNQSRIWNNTISSNSTITSYGVYLVDSKQDEVEDNTIRWNATGSVKNSYGIYAVVNTGVIAGNNNITGNSIWAKSGSSTASGVIIYNTGTSGSNLIQGNSLNASGSFSYVVYVYNTGTFNSNTIQSNNLDAEKGVALGVYMYNTGTMSSNLIQGNNASVSSPNSDTAGVYIGNSNVASSNTIWENILNVTSSASVSAFRVNGIFITSADFTNISQNTVNVSAPSAYAAGIHMESGANNNDVRNNTVKAGGTASDWGAYIDSSDSNTFVNNSVMSYGDDALYVRGSDSNTFRNNTFVSGSGAGDYGVYFTTLASTDNLFVNTSIFGGSGEDVYMGVAASTNNIFLNCSYTTEYVGSGAELIRQWYVWVNVTDASTGSAIDGATVTLENTTGALRHGDTTGSDGFTGKFNVTEYRNVSGTTIEATPYTVNASKTNYVTASESHEVTYNKVINITLAQGALTACQVLDIGGYYYQMAGSISERGPSCFNVTADNVTLDCNGQTVDGAKTHDWATAVNATNVLNFTLANCTITDWAYGVKTKYTNSSMLKNLSMKSYYPNIDTYAIRMTDSKDNQIYNNTILWNASGSDKYSYGVYILVNSGVTAGNINITNNGFIIESVSYAGGVYLDIDGTSNGNSFRNNNFDINTASSIYGGVYLDKSGTSNSYTIINNSFDIDASNVAYGVYLRSASGTSNLHIISNNTINVSGSTTVYGVYLYSSARSSKVSNNTIGVKASSTGSTSNAFGVHIYGSTTSATISNNTINTTSMGSSGLDSCGVFLDYADYTNISSNTINTSAPNAAQTAGLSMIDAASGGDIGNNTIRVQDYGVYMTGDSDSNTLINNSVVSYGDYGVYTDSADTLTLVNNTIESQSSYAIRMSVSNPFTVENNTVRSMSGLAIYLSRSSNGVIRNNTITAGSGLGDDGIFMRHQSDNNIIEHNNIRNADDGIQLDEDGGTDLNNNIIRYNTIWDAAKYGIFVATHAHGTRIYSNTIGDPVCGINISKALNVVVANNTVANNTFGIFAYNSSNLQVWNNSIYNNTYGITLNDTDSARVWNNSIYDTDSPADDVYGVWVKGGAEDNKFWDTAVSAGTGVYMSAETNTNNTFLNCSYDSEYVGAGAQLIRQWYITINVTDGTDPLDADVTIENRTGELLDSDTTSAVTGLSKKFNVTQYVNLSGTVTYWTNITVNATKNGYNDVSESHNFTDNKVINISMTLGALSECFVLDEANTYYTLTASITDRGPTCFNVTADNVTLDLNGFTVDGAKTHSWATAVNATNVLNFTLANGSITDWRYGVKLNMTNSSTFRNLSMRSTYAETTYAIYMTDSNLTTIRNNTIEWNATGASKNSYGIYIYENSGIYVGGNSVAESRIRVNSSSGSAAGVEVSGGDASNSNEFENNSFYVNSSSESYGIIAGGLAYFGSNKFGNNSFTVEGSSADGITVLQGIIYSNNITNNTFKLEADSSINAIELNVFGGVISSNRIDDNTINVGDCSADVKGIYVYGSVFMVGGINYITNNAIDVDASGTVYGIDYSGSAVESPHSTISNNTINVTSSAAASAFRAYGVYVWQSAEFTNISQNTINVSAPNAYAAGVYMDNGATDNDVQNNTIWAGGTDGDYGSYLNNSDSNTFVNNSVRSYGDDALYVTGSDSNTFRNNTLTPGSDSGDDGVYIYGNSDSNIVENNTIQNAGGDGVYLDDTTTNDPNNNVIRNNRIMDATRYGVFVSEDAEGTRVYDNTIGDPICGINISKAVNVVVANNTVANNTYGIFAYNSSNLQVWNNTVYNNTYGITLNDTDSARLWNNSIYDTDSPVDDVYGVWVKGGAEDNTFWDTPISAATNGVYMSAAANTNNTFLNCSYDSEYVGSGAELIRQWYIWVNVTDASDGTPVRANVTFENRTGDKWDGNQTTSATTGLTPKLNLTEYRNVSGTTLWWTNYTINVTAATYNFVSESHNFTFNKVINITLTQGALSNCAVLDTAGQYYTLTTSITDRGPTCFNVTADNVTLDLQGNTVDGAKTHDWATAVNATNVLNFTLANGSITDWRFGVKFKYSNQSEIKNVSFTSTYGESTYAIWITDSNLTTIRNNTIEWNATGANKNSYGIYIKVNSGITAGRDSISDNILKINSSQYTSWGVYLSNTGRSEYNKVSNNTVNVNASFYAHGIALSAGTTRYNTISNNTVNVNGSANAYGIEYSVGVSSLLDSNVASGNRLDIDGRSNAHGVYYENAFATSSGSFNVVSNNTLDVLAYSSSAYGVYWIGSSGTTSSNTFSNNTINATSPASASAFYCYGILLDNADFSNVSGNAINVSAPNAYAAGVYATTGADNNDVENNTIRAGGTASDYGVYLSSSSSNTIANNSVRSYGDDALCLDDADSNTFRNDTLVSGSGSKDYGVNITGGSVDNLFIDTPIFGGSDEDVYLSDEANTDNTFINCSYEQESVGSGAELIRKWYVWVNVTDISESPIDGANCKVYNVTGDLAFEAETGATGLTPRRNVTHYVNLSGTTTYANPYEFNVTYDGLVPVSQQDDVDHNLVENVTMGQDPWHYFYGFVSGNITLRDSAGNRFYKWIPTQKVGHVFIANTDSSIDWLNLTGLGRTEDGGASTDDFEEADTDLEQPSAVNGVNDTFSTDGSAGRETRDYTIFGRLVQDVPVENSSNNTAFMTGVLWDSSDGADDEYGNENEDLVIVTKINESTKGKWGTYDYEVRVPHTMDTYKGASGTVTFYMEIV
jgi:parallel beta-helix repeat protein